MSHDPSDLMPSLRELGDRLGDAAAREIASEQDAPPRRRRRRWHPYVFGGIVATLVAAGGVTATDIFTGSGDPVPEERSSPSQPGVLTDSAAFRIRPAGCRGPSGCSSTRGDANACSWVVCATARSGRS